MSETKKGWRVEAIVKVYDENGNVVSDIPRGSWYGFTRPMANSLAIAVNQAVVHTINDMNKAVFGDSYIDPLA